MVFTSEELIEKCKWLVNDVPNTYWSENGTWCTLWNNLWLMDCVCSIKGLLWGFQADPNLPRGGAVYGSNGVADFGANQGIDFCTEVSNDFSNLVPGEYLCMAGSPYEHCGIYLGNGKVFECTVEWGTYRCIISDIDKNGTRTYNGMGSVANWTWHGKLIYIDYSQEPTPVPPAPTTYNVGDVVEINGVYISSVSENELPPATNQGTITLTIEGARNPYLLDDGNIGWVNDNCIVRKIEDTPSDEEILDLVRRTIRGDFGNGEERAEALGDLYDIVQYQVEQNYAHGTTNWDDIRLY